jgi:1-acyl-sn-glycerol-3-phosphate acyltransferase
MRRKLLNTLLHMLYFLLLRLEVAGRENVPPTGPLILMINHVGAIDPFVVTGVFPRPVTSMSKIEVFSIPLIGILVRAYGAIPVHRGRVDKQAMRQAYQVLEEGGALLIAPEGTRSPTHSLQQGKEGIALIAARSGAPIIPVAITGTQNSAHCWKRLRRVPVRIMIGRPFRLDAGGQPLRRPLLRAMTDEAMYQLATTLPASYRGVYENLNQASESHVVVLGGGRRGPRVAHARQLEREKP